MAGPFAPDAGRGCLQARGFAPDAKLRMLRRTWVSMTGSSAEGLALPGRLVSADWLSRSLHAPDLVILDATVPYSDDGPSGPLGFARWEAAHIPTSLHADIASALSDPNAAFSFAFPSEDRLVPALQALGVGDRAKVVLYDDFLNMWATRLWWMLRAIGFEDVAVLDGGWRAWNDGRRPVESGPPRSVPQRPLTANARPAFIDRNRILDNVAGRRPGETLVCALPPDYFAGEVPVGGRRGHIPGSLNIPAASLLDDTGRFLPDSELRAKLSGLSQSTDVAVYCGGGISATVIAFALELIGAAGDRVHVYDGSLEDWNADPARPLAVGA